MANNTNNFKVLLIGNSSAGKSSIMLRYCDNKFTHNLYSTIGIDYIKYIEMGQKKVKLQIWDTAGQDRFKTVTANYYRGANAVALIYDLTDRQSYEAVEMWLGQLEKYADEGIKKIIVGNKSDLQARRQVSSAEGKKLAERLGLQFIESSAKTGHNVDLIFSSLCKMWLSSKPVSQQPKIDIKKQIKDQEEYGCCS